jgi:hypothetical protein
VVAGQFTEAEGAAIEDFTPCGEFDRERAPLVRAVQTPGDIVRKRSALASSMRILFDAHGNNGKTEPTKTPIDHQLGWRDACVRVTGTK